MCQLLQSQIPRNTHDLVPSPALPFTNILTKPQHFSDSEFVVLMTQPMKSFYLYNDNPGCVFHQRVEWRQQNLDQKTNFDSIPFV